jgi:hypothetical protein
MINIFGGSTIQPAQVAYAEIALAANTTLVWPQQSVTTTDSVARTMRVTPAGGGLSLTMPDARKVSKGFDFLVGNAGGAAFTLKDASGGTIASIPPGEVKYLCLTDNTTQGGSWYVIAFGVAASLLDASSLAGPGLVALSSKLARAEPVTLFSVGNTIALSDRAKVYVWTGGAGTQQLPSAAIVGSDFSYELRNAGTGVLTLAATGGETIDSSPSLALQPTESLRVHSSGVASWYTVGRGRSTQFNYSLLVKAITGGSVVLTNTEASNTVQRYTGALASNATITVPPVVQVYYLSNQTTGAYSFTVGTGLGTTATIPQGQNAILFCDGVNVINASTVVSVVSSLLLSQGTVGAPSFSYSGDSTTGIFQPAPSSMAVTIAGSQVALFGATGLSVTGIVSLSDGTAAAPALTFTADTDTGLYRPAANQLGVTVNGALVGLFKATGLEINGVEVGNRRLVPASVTTGTPVATDSGKCIYATGGVTIPNAVFAQGDCLTIRNTTSGNITITASITTLNQAGTANTGNRTLAQHGVVTVLFDSGTQAVIGGSGLT